MNTTDVENFPGFRDGIMGPELMDSMRGQAERFGAQLIPDDVTEVDLTGEVKVVRTVTEEHYARSVILAMGSGYRRLGLPREDSLSGRGVSWCATCDGLFFRDKPIVVVGGGDSAVEEATFLTRFGSSVTLLVRRDELRASKIMQDRAFADPKLEIARGDRLPGCSRYRALFGPLNDRSGLDRVRPELEARRRSTSLNTARATVLASVRRPGLDGWASLPRCAIGFPVMLDWAGAHVVCVCPRP